MTRSDIEDIAVDDYCPALGRYKIVQNSLLDDDNTQDFDRHCFIVGVGTLCK